MIISDFGAVLRRLREEKEYTISKLSSAAGISESTLSRWERGLCKPRFINDISRIAKSLDVPEDIFLSSHDDRIKTLEDKVNTLEKYIRDLEIKVVDISKNQKIIRKKE